MTRSQLGALLVAAAASSALAAPLPPGDYELEAGGRYTFTVAGSPVPATYVLTTLTAGTGSGTASGGGNYVAGATVTLTATAASGSTFAGWSPSPCAASFTMPSAPLTCTATFNQNVAPPTTYPLSVTLAGNGSGTATGSGYYAAGATVTLQATPATGSVFAGWSPSPCASTFPMPASPLTCTATFTLSPPPPANGPKWVLLNPGPVIEAQYGANFELGAAFDPVRNRIFAPDQRGYPWVYDLVGADRAVIRALNNGQQFRGGERNCSFAYLPSVDAVVTINCGTSATPPDGFPVFRFPDNDTVVTTYQCTNCGGPQTANFLGWNAALGAITGVGGWGVSQDTVQSYALPAGAFPPTQTPWSILPQSGAVPNYTGCWMCKEALRRGVLRNGQYVFVDPLTYDLHTYDFTTSNWVKTVTSKPAQIPVNGVVGYDPVRDILVVWIGTDALYGSGPRIRQTWIYSFANNAWSLGPNDAAGDVTPGYALGILSYMLWDSNLSRNILITTDGSTTGFTRIWALHWN